MPQFRIRGPQDGSDLGSVSATIGALTDSATINSYRFPSTQTVLPTISDAFVSDGTLTPDDNGITVTTRTWRNADTQASLGSGATLSTSGLGGVWVEYSPDNGTTWSPPVMVYMDGSDSTHNADDAAILTIVPHSEATHIAVNTGAWTSPSTWSTGEVPKNGAFVLIPHGVSVKYDNEEANIRLDRVRVDGTLWIDAANLTTETLTMLVETIVVTRGATFTAGTSGNDRIPATASVEIIISGKDYSATSYLPTDIKSSRFQNARGWERGFIVQGTRRLWGADKLTWSKADPIDAGATSLTLHKTPTGWAVGDTIVIGGTKNTVSGSGTTEEDPQVFNHEDEERVITGISGNVISWTTGLTYPHKNQLSGSTRTDLYPNVLAKGNKNITIRSEVTSPNYRRGHDVQMHHHTVVDLWDTQFIDLGRTDKHINSGIIKTSNPSEMWGVPEELGYYWPNQVFRPLTNQSNLQSRYSIHLHHVGFNHAGARPIVANCYVENSPGWAVVHHSCDADFQGLAIYKFYGAGLVSEQGDELGAWVDCLAMHATAYGHIRTNDPDKVWPITGNPKIRDDYGAVGDGGRQGYAFYFRGRAMRTNRCVANSVGYGHVFFNRGSNDPNLNVVPMARLDRANLDIQGAQMGVGVINEDNGATFDPIDYPIIHHSDNEAVATEGGLFVTKASALQKHDVNIKIKRMKSWGYRDMGAMVEYIGTYILDEFDVVAGPDGVNGILLDANTEQVMVVNPRVEGGSVGVRIGGGLNNRTYNQDDPRWGIIGLDLKNVTTPYEWGLVESGGSSNETATLIVDDFDGSYIDYDLAPSESWPLVLIDADTSGVGVYFDATAGDGTKTDNISALGALIPEKISADTVIKPRLGSYNARKLGEITGKWSYDAGSGTKDTIVFSEIISDRLTGRPHKVTHMAQGDAGGYYAALTSNGTYTYVATPVSTSDVTSVVAKDGSVVIDVLTDASPSGGDGTFVLDAPDTATLNKEWSDTIKSDHGVATINGTSGEVTYSPDRDYTGTDEFYVIVRSGSQYSTVRINVLITASGTDGGTTQPAETTHFTVADGGSQTIDIALLDPPDTSNRRITRVFYSTNGGTNWRRLCQHWPLDTHTISVDSQGNAITAGSYDILLKYRTDHDYVDVTAAAAASVTVA